MISIIIIGKNVESTLRKSLESAFRVKSNYNNLDFEIIYVDSKSNDNSLSIASDFKHLKIVNVLGEINAAIGRNIGAKVSQGDVLFFIDADMEIEVLFLDHILNEKGDLIYDSVSGHIDDYLYTPEGKFIEVKGRTYHNKMHEESNIMYGGVFVIKSFIWRQLNGMDNRYVVHEDFEFSCRLLKCNYSTLRIPHLIVKHHTVDYMDSSRVWGYVYRHAGMLARENLNSVKTIFKIFRLQYSAFLFFFAFLMLLTTLEAGVLFTLLYLMLVIARAWQNCKNILNKGQVYLTYFLKYISLLIYRDLNLIFNFFTFFPKVKKEQFEILTSKD